MEVVTDMLRALETFACHRCRLSAITIQRLFLFLIISLFLPLFAVTTTFAAQTTLAWDPPVNADGTPFTGVAGYHLYFGTSSGTYSQSVNAGNVTSYTISNLAEGATYYFAVTDYDAAGNESAYSNEVSKTFSATYSLTATAGTGGTISPVGSITTSTATNGTYIIKSVTAPQGTNVSFTVTANQGYQLSNVTVDGISAGKISSYTFNNINSNHSITATFTTTAGTTPLKGDVDSDGVVSLDDALTVLRSVTNNAQLTTDQKSRADVWPLDASGKPLGDGSVNLNDALLILRRAVGLVTW
ncbi:MAG: hypothetical protein CXR31_07480 [Geobacter sp.]|nr:MAG: hypothetical protein CXR31_07480 [Geobacter sp.]